MLIDPKFLTEQEIKQTLMDIVNSQPDAAKWTDWFAGGNGTTIIDLLTAVSVFLNFNAVSSRRESNPVYGKLKSTLYSSAALMGYPINRKTSAKFQLVITNTGDSVFWDKTDPIGTFYGAAVCLDTSQQLVPGQNTVTAFLGQWESFTQTVPVNQQYYEMEIPLTVTMEHVCNTEHILYVDDIVTETSNYIEDLIDNKAILRTYVSTISIMMGGNIGPVVTKGQVMRFDWIQISDTIVDPNSKSYTPDNFNGSTNIQLVSCQILRRQIEEDSLDKIAKLIPGYFASRRRMISPADHEAVINAYPGILSSKFALGICSHSPLFTHDEPTCIAQGGTWDDPEDGECCTKAMSYLREDYTPFSDTEEEELYNTIKNANMIAGNYIVFDNGIPVLVMAKLIVLIEEDFTNVNLLQGYIEALIQKQCNVLGGKFNVGELVSDVNSISGVQYSTLIRPRYDLWLSWQGYFKFGQLDIVIVTSKDDMMQYGGEDGGYLPYAPDVTTVMIQSWSSQGSYYVGDTIEIDGYVAGNGTLIVGAVVTVTGIGPTQTVSTKQDGTFVATAIADTTMTGWTASVNIDGTVYTSTGTFTVNPNIYALTATSDKTSYKVGDNVLINITLSKNTVPITATVYVIGLNNDSTTDTPIPVDIINGVGSTALVAKLIQIGARITYDAGSVHEEQTLSWTVAPQDMFVITASSDKQIYLVNEVATITASITNNGVGFATTMIAHPIYDGAEATNIGRNIPTDSTGAGTLIYVCSNDDVIKVMQGFNIYRDFSSAEFTTVNFTVAINPNP